MPVVTEAEAPSDRLLALLAEERAALLSGDLGALSVLSGRKEALAEILESEVLGQTQARDVAAAARQNQALLKAAIEGLQAARTRLETARAGGPPLSTYGADGRAQTHSTAKPGLERRV